MLVDCVEHSYRLGGVTFCGVCVEQQQVQSILSSSLGELLSLGPSHQTQKYHGQSAAAAAAGILVAICASSFGTGMASLCTGLHGHGRIDLVQSSLAQTCLTALVVVVIIGGFGSFQQHDNNDSVWIGPDLQ